MKLNSKQIKQIEQLTKGKYDNSAGIHCFQNIPTNTFCWETQKRLWIHMIICNDNIHILENKEPNYVDPKSKSFGIPLKWLIPLAKILKGEK